MRPRRMVQSFVLREIEWTMSVRDLARFLDLCHGRLVRRICTNSAVLEGPSPKVTPEKRDQNTISMVNNIEDTARDTSFSRW